MRVLHVGKFYPPFAGGMEYFLADLLGALSAQGIQVAALVHCDRSGQPGSGPGLSDRVPLYRAPILGRLLYTPLSPTFPFWLHRAIREFRPDLLHLHLPNPSAFWAMALPAAQRLSRVVHWHSDVVTSGADRRLSLAYRLYRPLEQRLLGRSRAIIATSPTYLEASRALAPWRSHCEVVPLGLDPARFPDPDASTLEHSRLLWNGPGLRILAVGRLTYYKGFDRLVQAMSDLPGARLLLVGCGDEQARLTARVRALGLTERVGLLGFRTDAEVHGLLATCDVLCLPSLERGEAFGLVLLEAMRFGKPVVASDIPGSGTGWVVRQAGHGLLVPPGDAAALARGLRKLAEHPGLRRGFGARGLAALQEQFNIRSTAASLADLYRRIHPGR